MKRFENRAQKAILADSVAVRCATQPVPPHGKPK